MIDILILLIILLLLNLLTDFWWWIIVIPSLYAFVRGRTGKQAFLLGFASVGLVWLGMGLYQYFTGAEIVASRVAEMMGLGSPWLLLALTVLVAALAGGFAGSTGFHLGKALNIRKDHSKGDRNNVNSH